MAIVQGATEFIPISSSGHLVLVRAWFGWSDEGGVVLDTVLHAGSLLAILLYFWREWVSILQSRRSPNGEDATFYRKLPLLLSVATLPIFFTGPFIAEHLERFRNGGIVGLFMIITAGWFFICENKKKDKAPTFTYRTALLMGLVQIIALIPGVSRSGVTTATGVLCGQKRENAARFSFFMAIPAIIGAIILKSPEMLSGTHLGLPSSILWVGFVTCFTVSFFCIHFCLQLFRKYSLVGLGIYLAGVGIVLVCIKHVYIF